MFGQDAIHANFSVDDLAVAKEFYIDTLGFRLHREDAGQIVLEGGAGTKVNIYYKPDHRAWDSTVMGIEVDDLDQAVERLADNGISIEKVEGTDSRGIIHDPLMGDAAWFRDPAGNWICVNHFL